MQNLDFIIGGWGGRWVGICLHCAAFRVANGRDGPWRLHFLCQSTVATCSRERCGDISREQIVHQFLNCSLFCLTYLMDFGWFWWMKLFQRTCMLHPTNGRMIPNCQVFDDFGESNNPAICNNLLRWIQQHQTQNVKHHDFKHRISIQPTHWT